MELRKPREQAIQSKAGEQEPLKRDQESKKKDRLYELKLQKKELLEDIKAHIEENPNETQDSESWLLNLLQELSEIGEKISTLSGTDNPATKIFGDKIYAPSPEMPLEEEVEELMEKHLAHLKIQQSSMRYEKILRETQGSLDTEEYKKLVNALKIIGEEIELIEKSQRRAAKLARELNEGSDIKGTIKL